MGVRLEKGMGWSRGNKKKEKYDIDRLLTRFFLGKDCGFFGEKERRRGGGGETKERTREAGR
jgi:hypothetical protein